jgi:hypothetical protein
MKILVKFAFWLPDKFALLLRNVLRQFGNFLYLEYFNWTFVISLVLCGLINLALGFYLSRLRDRKNNLLLLYEFTFLIMYCLFSFPKVGVLFVPLNDHIQHHVYHVFHQDTLPGLINWFSTVFSLLATIDIAVTALSFRKRRKIVISCLLLEILPFLSLVTYYSTRPSWMTFNTYLSYCLIELFVFNVGGVAITALAIYHIIYMIRGVVRKSRGELV